MSDNKDFRVIVGRRLKEARNKAGMTQQQVADALGVARSTVATWESGQNDVDTATLKRLAEMYGTTTDWLLGSDDTPDPQESPDMTERLMRVLEDLAASLREREAIERMRVEMERMRVEQVEAVRARAEAEREASIARILDALLGEKDVRREQAAAGEPGAREAPLTGEAAAGR